MLANPQISSLRLYGRGVRSLATLLLVALVLSSSVLGLADAPRPYQVQSPLTYGTGAPVVRVIIQKERGAVALEALVARLGGVVTGEFPIINALEAQLPAPAVAHLARVAGVRGVSLDAPLQSATCDDCIDTSQLISSYIKSIRADKVWNEAPYMHGDDIGVAVIDTGIDTYAADLQSRLVIGVRVNAIRRSPRPGSVYTDVTIRTSNYDTNGHGTHVAGIIGGDGSASGGAFIGVAPGVNLISLQVTDAYGKATTGNVIHALQWILENKDQYNIRVVNISLNSAVAESAQSSPINAAAEVLWFNGIVVVVSAGNNGTSTLYPPANDPFVITVGAADDKGTPDLADDVLAPYSAYGTTDGDVAKPDLVAPGRSIVSILSSRSVWGSQYAERVMQSGRYFRLSGTSMAAPMVAGAAALLLQDEPNLTPDQVKYRLMATANKSWPGYNATRAGAGYLDVYAAVTGSTTASANTGRSTNQLLWTGSSTPNWGSVNWGSVNWGSVNWGSVNWGSVNWGSDYWND